MDNENNSGTERSVFNVGVGLLYILLRYFDEANYYSMNYDPKKWELKLQAIYRILYGRLSTSKTDTAWQELYEKINLELQKAKIDNEPNPQMSEEDYQEQLDEFKEALRPALHNMHMQLQKLAWVKGMMVPSKDDPAHAAYG